MKSLKTVIAFVVLFGILCGFAACAWAEQYPRIFFVEAVDSELNLVTLYDVIGETWYWYDAEDWMVEDMAAAIMDDNGTPNNIHDDIIIKLYYQDNIGDWDEPDEVWVD